MTDGPILTLFVNVQPSAAVGSYTIAIANALGADPSGNAVSILDASGAITVSAQNGTPIQSGGVLNAASLLPGPVSPGEVVTLIGAGIGPLTPATLQLLPSGLVSTNLSNTVVSFDSVNAPLLYASLNQINAVVPFELSGQSSTLLTISQAGQPAASIVLQVAPAAPALFTQDGSGAGPLSILNEDLSLNTPVNPAAPGSVVTLYLTGAGLTDPLGLTGAITVAAGTTLLPATATVGGLPADVLYSGPAPGLIAGVSQINLRVPVGASSSLAAPVSIQIGTVSTQDGVSLSIR